MSKQKRANANAELKIPSQRLEIGNKTSRAKATKTELKSAITKPVLLKLPPSLKKAARACAKDQGLKLRVWIVDLIKIQVSKESASSAPMSLQTE